MATRHRDLRRRTGIIAAFICTIWLISLLNVAVFGGRLAAFGILPRTEQGLPGIVLAPLIHGGVHHLLANTAGLLLFGGLVMFRSERHFWTVTLVGILASGAGTWLFGRPALHVGASGVIFAYFGYLIFTGFFERRIGPLLLSVAVFVIWGPTLYGVLPTERAVSWEGHIFGLLGGMLAAWVLAGRPFRGGI
ncbi:MAG TPA: rhomboid family intramembrane serine protease [Burkholderiales bacterium]|nr:rhomboid family intramembrane serine protease [Burkholderiales bacterium]